MTSCSDFEDLFQSLLAGEQLSQKHLEDLEGHARQCPQCRGLLELHRELGQQGADLAGVSESRFASMRRRVLAQTAGKTKAAAASAFEDPAAARQTEASRPRRYSPAWAVAAGLLLLLGGALLGRMSVAEAPFQNLAGVSQDPSLIREISQEAEGNDDFSDAEDSPFIYSDVKFRPLDDGQVALSFNVARHVEVIEPVDSPLVREVLVQSLLVRESESLGSRLKAVSLASQTMDPKVRQALTFAMHHDDSLAVRQKALSILAELPMDADLEEALLQTLREDPSVQMRLLALEVMGRREMDSETLREAISELEQRGDRALLLKATEFRQ